MIADLNLCFSGHFCGDFPRCKTLLLLKMMLCQTEIRNAEISCIVLKPKNCEAIEEVDKKLCQRFT